MTRPSKAQTRVAWFEGAGLRHVDLRDAVAHEARMLALHVGAMHRAWGAAFGLAVVIDATRRQVLVTSGLAYTCRGEPLILASALRLDPPAPRAPLMGDLAFDLVASVATTPEGAPCERMVACDGKPLRAAALALRWELAGVIAPGANGPPTASGIRIGDEVPLARVLRHADGTLDGPDYARRRIARGLSRPHIASGTLDGGSLAWRDDGSRAVATIDTSGSGFTAAPRYFVANTPGSSFLASAAIVVGPFASIENASAAAFDLCVTFAAPPGGAVSAVQRRAQAASRTYLWTGVEMNRGCPPSFQTLRAISLAGALVDTSPWASSLALLEGSAP